MLNTPLKADKVYIYDRDGTLIATCRDPTVAQQLVQMVNATAAGG